MKLKDLEAELEATRKKIHEQLFMVGKRDTTLYKKEEVLELAIASWHNEFDTIAEPEDYGTKVDGAEYAREAGQNVS